MSSFIYKYLPPCYKAETPTEWAPYLTNELMCFSSPSCLNDALECGVMDIDDHFEVLYNKLSKGREGGIYKAIKEMLKDREFDNLRHFYRGLFYIFSMASNSHSSAMWAHYAANHSGICIGYDLSHPFFRGDGQFLLPVEPVVYRTTPAVYSKASPKGVLFTKAIEWAYEQESRMVLDFSNNSSSCDKGPKVIERVIFDKCGHITGCFVKVPFDAITEIVIGCRADEDFSSFVENRAKELGKKVLYARPSNNSFQIEKATQRKALVSRR